MAAYLCLFSSSTVQLKGLGATRRRPPCTAENGVIVLVKLPDERRKIHFLEPFVRAEIGHPQQ
jgi:hypothetical protein